MNTLISKMSLRVQLLLIFTLVFTLAFAAFTAIFYSQFSTYAENLAKDRLQAIANEMATTAAASVTSEDVFEIREQGEEALAYQEVMEVFNEVQELYEDIDAEVALSVINRENRSALGLIYLQQEADESDPVEQILIEDDELWQVWVDSTIEPLYYEVEADGEELWTSASNPVLDENGEPVDAVVDVHIRTENELAAVRAQVRDTLMMAVGVGYPLLLIVIFLVSFTFTRALNRLTTAATAIEQDEPYQKEWLQPVVRRGDEIGRLGRVFDKMANEVRSRVDRLKSEVVKLRIEVDQSRKQQQVAEITNSDYFKELQEKAASVRRRIPRLDGEDDDESGE
jgi:hypothetical protein